jgi:membrane protein YqaA with SNARE-associated domain
MIRKLAAWMVSLAATPYGGWALFGLAFAESSCFPLPPDLLLIALGVAQPDKALWFGLVCTAGSVTGGMFGYALGLYSGRPLLYRLFNQRRVAHVEALYNRYDAWATAIAGLTPIPYKVFTIAGGVFKIRFRTFVLASVGSRGLRFLAEGIALMLWGRQVAAFLRSYFDLVTLGVVVVGILGFLAVSHLARAHQRTEPAEKSP